MSTPHERLDRMEVDLRKLYRELLDLRAEVQGTDATEATGAPSATAPPLPPPAPAIRRPAPVETRPPVPPPPPEPRFWEREPGVPKVEVADLLGARGLALAGGVVTLLGVVFFFALAASNGWIGPLARVLLGGAASAIVLAGGVFAQRRYGKLHAAVAAAGAGIAGGYATLLFATVRYELITPLAALGIAAAIAALAVAISLEWSSEIVAGFGLIGAMCVPAVLLLDGRTTATAVGFVALVFLGATIVSVQQRWRYLLVAAGAVSVPQLLTLILQEGEPARARVLVVVFAFELLYLAAGIARQVRADGARLDGVASVFAGGNVALTLLSSFALLAGDARGIALAAAAAVYGAVAVAGWKREPELAALSAAAGSALAAVAVAQFLEGPALVVAWAAETVVLAWLGRRLAETRFQLLGSAYLGLALLYALVTEAPPDLLYERFGYWQAGVVPLLAVAAGAAGYGWLARSWPAPRGLEAMPSFLRRLVGAVHGRRRTLSYASFVLAAVLATDAASLALLQLAVELGVEPAFDWGHVAVTGLWSLIALALLAIGARRTRLLEAGGAVTLGAAIVSYGFFTAPELEHVSGWAALVLAGACAAAALVHGLLSGRPERVGFAAAVALGGLFSVVASVQLLEEDAHGYGLLGAAAAHVLVAAAVWRKRDLATSFWAAGAALGTGAAALLLADTWLVLALALGAVAAAAAGRVLAEPRLWLASASLVAIAGGYTLAELAEPADFFRAAAAPADGVPAMLLVGAALGALLLSLRPFEPADELDRRLLSSIDAARAGGLWLLAGLGLYAASLAILGLADGLSDTAQVTELQRGHTAVSAFWGLVALAALVVGLRRRLPKLRLAALVLFALALGKLFLYDLSTLSSVSRALSFLAVGAVLLLAGFFYQRLSSEAPA